MNPIVSRMKFSGVLAIPRNPDILFRSYMLRAQLAPRDRHVNYFVSCMRAACKSM